MADDRIHTANLRGVLAQLRARFVPPRPFSAGFAAGDPEDLPGIAAAYGRLRLRTFIALRWLAVAGQIGAILVVYFGFGFSLPLGWCLGAVGASAALNLFILWAAPAQRLARQWEAALQLAFDIGQLALLVGLTGGLSNPFVLMMIAPVTVAAATLELRYTLALAALACVLTLVLAAFSAPLPWLAGVPFSPPPLFKFGFAVALIVGMLFSAIYAWRVSSEEAELIDALAATQSVLERERRLSALGGLAAATAHELGTPLATIHIAAKEMLADLAADDRRIADVRLIALQSDRCRAILHRLSRESGDNERLALAGETMALDRALDEIVQPFRDAGSRIEMHWALETAAAPIPRIGLRPELRHGLFNFIENACSYASTRVVIGIARDAESLEITISDDGPGFPPDLLSRLGKPFISRRQEDERGGGLGLGFFIAKTLLERTGARLYFTNQGRVQDRLPANGAPLHGQKVTAHAGHGAVVRIQWPRWRVELPD